IGICYKRSGECRVAKKRSFVDVDCLMHSLKRHTALRCNEILGRRGCFWQDESFEHCYFDLEELERIVEYVEQNPVKAGLVDSPEDWLFSSAGKKRQPDAIYGPSVVLE
ncbi:MAG: transposase, partial [Gemmataceae bacterium]